MKIWLKRAMGEVEKQVKERIKEVKSVTKHGWKAVGAWKKGWYKLRQSLNI